ncbi:MAG: sugar phosphate isomerase/epimerase [Lachnospiraceae bacterium]|nr:sugar phosphate isomerase/epimerase [Lachnospiraceae bacterium]
MILLSTNMYTNEEFEQAFYFVEKYPQIGLELFPLWNTEEYGRLMEQYEDKLKKIPNSFHEQYFGSEHSASEGHAMYEFTEDATKKTVALAKKLNSHYIVYHYNNCEVTEENRTRMLENARKNLKRANELAKENGVQFVIENVGVLSRHNVLLSEQEFIDECRMQPNHVLIDIGHAWCNGWNLENVIASLKDKIIAYHVHNNHGKGDSHQRIHNGTMDFDGFFELYKKYTPDAEMVIEYAADVRTDIQGIEDDIKELLAKGV